MSTTKDSQHLGVSASVSEYSGHSETVTVTTLSAHGGHAEEKETAGRKQMCACASVKCSCEDEKLTSRRRSLFRETWVCRCKDDCPAKTPVKAKGKKAKKVTCPTRQKVQQIASSHVHTEICFDDGERPTVGDEFTWVTVTPWMMLVLHKSRRLTHHLWIVDPETGELDGYLESKLRMLTESLQVRHAIRRGPNGPYAVGVQCPKDRGDCKECKTHIDTSVVVKGLVRAVSMMSEGTSRDRLVQLLRRFEGAVMQALLAFDAERVKETQEYGYANPYAEYTKCPRTGCAYCNGFRCDPRERRLQNGRTAKIVRCPDPRCLTDGDPTHWCSLCGRKHMEHEHCPLPDPRAEMSPEELAEYDKEVRAGNLQVCVCGAFHAKDDGCDSIHCPRRGCGRHICFGCGAEIGDEYTNAHMTVGPRELHPGTTHWGCRRTYARKAASNEESEYRTEVRAWLLRSVNSRTLMVEAQFVLRDPLRPLEEGEGKVWLAALVARAIGEDTL